MTPANDLYSLGCVLYAVHMGGQPPFVNRASMQSLRDQAEGSLVRRDWASGSKWERCSSELKGASLSAGSDRILTARQICCPGFSLDIHRTVSAWPHSPHIRSSPP